MSILAGIFMILSPWMMKNAYDMIRLEKPMSVFSVLLGVSEGYVPDYHSLYSQQELDTKTENIAGISQTGTTSNADFGRYF